MAALQPYVPIELFISLYPVNNRSSRVFRLKDNDIGVIPYDPGPDASYALSVADAFLRDVGGVVIALSVSVGTIRDAVPHDPDPDPTGSPNISLGATSLVFAETEVGAHTDMTVVISNTGDADLVISGLTFTGDFSAVSFA